MKKLQACPKKEVSAKIADALTHFAKKQNIVNQDIIDFQLRALQGCAKEQKILKKIYNYLPKVFRKALIKSKNIRKFKEFLVGAITKVEFEIDGIPHSATITDSGTVQFINKYDGTASLNVVSSEMENIINKEIDKFTVTGFLARKGNLENRDHGFTLEFSGKDFSDLSKKKRAELLGYFEIKSSKVFKLNEKGEKVAIDFKGVGSPLLNDYSLKSSLTTCKDTFCVVGLAKVKRDFLGDLVVSSSMSRCSGGGTREICIGVYQRKENDKKNELGLNLTTSLDTIALDTRWTTSVSNYGISSNFSLKIDKNLPSMTELRNRVFSNKYGAGLITSPHEEAIKKIKPDFELQAFGLGSPASTKPRSYLNLELGAAKTWDDGYDKGEESKVLAYIKLEFVTP